MASIAAPDLEAIKARQQATWASGDYSAVGARIPIISEQLCDSADLRAGWRCSTSPAEAGTRRWPPPAAAARSSASTTSRRCSSGPRARRGRGPRGRDRGGRRGGPALPRRVVRRGRLGGRRDVRAGPRAHGRRAPARLPARRHDRAGQLDPGRLHRRAVQDDRPARPSPGGADAAGAVGHRGARPGAPRRRRATLTATRRSYTFRYRSRSTSWSSSGSYYGPTHKAFAALDEDGPAGAGAGPRGARRAASTGSGRGRPRGRPGGLPRGRRDAGRLGRRRGRHLDPVTHPLRRLQERPRRRRAGPVAVPREGDAPVGELLRHAEERHPLIGDLHGEQRHERRAIPAPTSPWTVPLSSQRKTMSGPSRGRTSPSMCSPRDAVPAGHHREPAQIRAGPRRPPLARDEPAATIRT